MHKISVNRTPSHLPNLRILSGFQSSGNVLLQHILLPLPDPPVSLLLSLLHSISTSINKYSYLSRARHFCSLIIYSPSSLRNLLLLFPKPPNCPPSTPTRLYLRRSIAFFLFITPSSGSTRTCRHHNSPRSDVLQGQGWHVDRIRTRCALPECRMDSMEGWVAGV